MAEFHVFAAGNAMADQPVVRRIGVQDIWDALREGFHDFMARPSHYAFVVIIYPIIGFALVKWAAGNNSLQMLFPLVTGFALIGPFAAIGLYEISRRLEQKRDTSWRHAFNVRKSPAIPAILALGIMLLGVFIAWLYAAQAIYTSLYGANPPAELMPFFYDVIGTSRGWTLIFLGSSVGFAFALFVLCTTAVAFPLLLDRDAGAFTAVRTSLKAAWVNPVPMLLWGVIVAGSLFLGALPGLAGLIVVLPVLGHATWHVYRKMVVAPKQRREA
jgi:uncharacterized membrane protein